MPDIACVVVIYIKEEIWVRAVSGDPFKSKMSLKDNFGAKLPFFETPQTQFK